MRVLIALLAGMICLAAGNVRAADSDRLAQVLRISEMIEVLRDEGLAFGADLDADMLDGRGGAFWAARVARVYDEDRMQATVRAALANGMDDVQIAAALAFFNTDLGQQVLSLETSARVAIADPDVEAIARETHASLLGTADGRVAAISRLVEVNDLIERNVATAFNSNYQFMRGLAEGGASDLSDDQITAEIWSQEDEIRSDTEGWLFGFMLMAYNPLSDEDLEAYIAFSGSPAGLALNAALFDGFDVMFRHISRTMGVLVAQASESSEL